MYKIQEESNLKAMAECLKLGKKHYAEVFEHKVDKVPENYNWQFLKICMDNGLIHIITARDEEDKLIGYFTNLVSPDMFSSTFVAKELAIFVEKEHRKGGIFLDMLAAMEQLLIDNGVISQVLAFQVGHNEDIPLKYGYRHTENVYEKILLED